jgi:phospholipase C
MVRWRRLVLAVLPLVLLLPLARQPAGAIDDRQATGNLPIDYVIVIYQENHSFDNYFGLFPGADGLASATDALPQTNLEGVPYATLPRPIDTNQRPPAPDERFPATLANRPFDIGQFVPPEQKIGDLIHRYYREQYQINGGRMDRYAYWSDAAGLAMGYYDMRGQPLWRLAEEYTLADHFHAAAFGGSFLNHFFLVCACAPVWSNPPEDVVSRPMPDRPGYMQDLIVRPDGYAINTAQPFPEPHQANVPDDHRLPLQTMPHIGDRLDAAGVTWAWYAGGWDDAVAGRPGALFQYHHQPFNYFANVGGNSAARAQRLKDEGDFITALQGGTLPQVSWVKPYGTDNEHPGYADIVTGERHVEDLVRQIQASPYWSRAAVIITYDEFGGFWDHVAPPVVDEWGPGTRVPTIIVSPFAHKGYVDHTAYDTTSLLKLIETRWGLQPLGTRDAAVNDLRNAFVFP